MRFLKIGRNGELSLTQDIEPTPLKYAILSHTWSADNEDEALFEDFQTGAWNRKPAREKLYFCTAQAMKDGLEYVWIDTCCINKHDSAELSEAIRSMFRWYKGATKCYVYLADVLTSNINVSSSNQHEESQPWATAFRNSRWFNRGWTLQELLAPRSVSFFSCNGELLGTRTSLEGLIFQITGIPTPALRGSDLAMFSVEQRLKWAENRTTKKPEDKAYSLLGLFGVSMPIMYGEGYASALHRLRDETSKRNIPEPTYRGQHVSQKISSTSDIPGQPLKVTLHGLKRATGLTGDFEDVQENVYFPPDTTVKSVLKAVKKAHPDLYISKDVRLFGDYPAIDHVWHDCVTTPVQVTSGPSCYEPANGYRINCRQTIADFCSKVFPRPVHAQIDPSTHQTPVQQSSIHVKRDGNDPHLSIRFMRTVRVPDDGKTYPLPAGLGAFPLFNVSDFIDQAPAEMVQQGGIFFPMYQAEAMWIEFMCHGKRPWAVRPFVGGINGITGEAAIGNMNSLLQRMGRLSKVQDYVVIPLQQWLDGLAVESGTVRQFTATVMDSGSDAPHEKLQTMTGADSQQSADTTTTRIQAPVEERSVECQLTGRDSVGGLQLQIIPSHDTSRFSCGNTSDCTLEDGTWRFCLYPAVKRLLAPKVWQRLKSYDILKTPSEHKLHEGEMIYVKDLDNRIPDRWTVLSDLITKDVTPFQPLQIQLRSHHMAGPFLIITTNNSTFKLPWLGLSSTVGELMQEVANTLGIDPNCYRLTSDYEWLNPKLTLEACGLEPGMTLELWADQIGGGSCSFYVWIYGTPVAFDLPDEDQNVMALKFKISKEYQIPVERMILSVEGKEIKELRLADRIDLTLRPTDEVRMGLGIGGRIKQDIKADLNSPRIWDVANSKLLGIQILNAVDFYTITGQKPPATPITPSTYAKLNIPFFATYNDAPALEPTGAFSSIETVKAPQSGDTVEGPDQTPVESYEQALSKYLLEGEDADLSCNRVILLEPDNSIPAFTSVVDDVSGSEDDEWHW